MQRYGIFFILQIVFLFSTFITSAPNSAKKVATDGPAKTVETSMTFKFENKFI